MLCKVIVDLVAEAFESTKYPTVALEDLSKTLVVDSDGTSSVHFLSLSSARRDAEMSSRLRRFCSSRVDGMPRGVR